jgi:hypothetical protein
MTIKVRKFGLIKYKIHYKIAKIFAVIILILKILMIEDLILIIFI